MPRNWPVKVDVWTMYIFNESYWRFLGTLNNSFVLEHTWLFDTFYWILIKWSNDRSFTPWVSIWNHLEEARSENFQFLYKLGMPLVKICVNGTHEFFDKSQVQLKISKFVIEIFKSPKNEAAMVFHRPWKFWTLTDLVYFVNFCPLAVNSLNS